MTDPWMILPDCPATNANCTLLERVTVFKEFFFKQAWARYDEARAGRLRLSPPDRRVGQLKRDYEDMRPMFFNDPPPFEQILDHLPELENRINKGKQ